MCPSYVPGVSGGQKRALEPLELESQSFGSLHVSTGSQTFSGTSLDGSVVQPNLLHRPDGWLVKIKACLLLSTVHRKSQDLCESRMLAKNCSFPPFLQGRPLRCPHKDKQVNPEAGEVAQ